MVTDYSSQSGHGLSENGHDDRWRIGDIIKGRYEVHDVRMGGMGIVYIVYDHRNREPYAAKSFHARFFLHEGIRERFKREALTWINLDRHRNIVRAHWVEMIRARPFIFLEYVAGGTLRDWMKKPTLPVRDVMSLVVQICFGMEHCFTKGLVAHRDLKPENVLVTPDGVVKVTDFGLARSLDGAPAGLLTSAQSMAGEQSTAVAFLTEAGTTVGTPGYMPPEQLTDPSSCEATSDIYSFGTILHELLCRDRPPQQGSSNGLTFEAYPVFANIVSKCLRSDPRERFEGFRDLRTDLLMAAESTDEYLGVVTDDDLDFAELTNKGIALRNLRRPDQALVCYDEALARNPRDSKTWTNRGNVLNDLGRLEDAVFSHEMATKYEPANDKAWSNRGAALAKLGRLPEALHCLEQALALDVTNPVSWSNKGLVLQRLRRVEEALVCCQQALDIDPGMIEAWHNMGNVLAAMHRFEEATQCFETVLTIDPLNTDARQMSLLLRRLVARGASLQADADSTGAL